MQNNEKRNEIIRIFRKFSRLGLNSEALSPIQIYKKIDVLCVSRRARLDMLSVYDTLRLLWLDGDIEIIQAINSVYFEGKAYRLTKYDIGARVLALAQENHCDERTIYRRLEKARVIYEKVREKQHLISENNYFN